MFPVVTDGVAVYVFKLVRGRYHFLQLRRSADDETYGQSWHPVYGGVEGSESAMQTARRELFEETGIEPLQLIFIEFLETFYFRARGTIQMLPVFAAEVDNDVEIVLNEEHDDFRWVREDDINSMFTWRSQREALRVILETLKDYPDRIPLLLV